MIFTILQKDRMKEAIEYWLWEYNRQGFVRWAIISKKTKEAIGTIELFIGMRMIFLQTVVC